MQLKKGQIVEIMIDAFAFEGSGIGSFEGLRVFVADTMPGDKVKASFTKIKKNFAHAKLLEILEPSADRVKPHCKYSEVCGGCQLQFMPYQKQLEFKKQHVIDCFERIGKLQNPPVLDIIACDQEFYYRNKMEFSFGYDADMNFALGMHLPGRRYDILDLDECHLQSEVSVKIVNFVREFSISKSWVPFQFSCGEGMLRSLFIREAKRTNEIMVNISTSQNTSEGFEKELEELVDKMMKIDTDDKKIVSIYWTKVISKRGMPRMDRPYLLYGKNALTENMIIGETKLKFDIYPASFFQVNTYQAEILYSEIVKIATKNPQSMVFDLFCGTGTIGLFVAKHVDQVLGIELNESSVKAARENAMKNGIFNIDFFVGDVYKKLLDVRERPSLIIVDPPRAGLAPKAIDKINEFGPNQIVYVSCNPATLARDCELMSKYGYNVKSIQPVDMFPHTYHIENVCLLER